MAGKEEDRERRKGQRRKREREGKGIRLTDLTSCKKKRISNQKCCIISLKSEFALKAVLEIHCFQGVPCPLSCHQGQATVGL